MNIKQKIGTGKQYIHAIANGDKGVLGKLCLAAAGIAIGILIIVVYWKLILCITFFTLLLAALCCFRNPIWNILCKLCNKIRGWLLLQNKKSIP